MMVAEITLTDDESFGVAYELFRWAKSIFGQSFLSTGAIGGIIPAPSKDSLRKYNKTAITGFPPGISGIIGTDQCDPRIYQCVGFAEPHKGSSFAERVSDGQSAGTNTGGQ